MLGHELARGHARRDDIRRIELAARREAAAQVPLRRQEEHLDPALGERGERVGEPDRAAAAGGGLAAHALEERQLPAASLLLQPGPDGLGELGGGEPPEHAWLEQDLEPDALAKLIDDAGGERLVPAEDDVVPSTLTRELSDLRSMGKEVRARLFGAPLVEVALLTRAEPRPGLRGASGVSSRGADEPPPVARIDDRNRPQLLDLAGPPLTDPKLILRDEQEACRAAGLARRGERTRERASRDGHARGERLPDGDADGLASGQAGEEGPPEPARSRRDYEVELRLERLEPAAKRLGAVCVPLRLEARLGLLEPVAELELPHRARMGLGLGQHTDVDRDHADRVLELDDRGEDVLADHAQTSIACSGRMLPVNALPSRIELTPEQLRRRLDPAALPFDTTAELAPLEGTIGQPRALEAIEFGLEVAAPGFNLFVAGPPGSGRMGTIRDHLERLARTRPVPDDWVYVHSFAEPDRPNAIALPAGLGSQLARDMDEFLDGARREIPRAFESDDYQRRRQERMSDIAREREALTGELQTFARGHGFAVELTPAGIVTIPIVEGRPLSGEEFARLPAQSQREIERRGAQIQERVAAVVRQLRALEKEAAERLRALDREVAQFAVGQLFHDLREAYGDHAEVLAYLGQAEEDVLDHLQDFRTGGPEAELPAFLSGLQRQEREDRLSRYRVNVLFDNREDGGAPVVVERNPTYYALVGRVAYRAAFGTMVTDFHQIKPGALHRANGGFLVLDALEVLRNPFAWDALKRALQTRQVRIENLAEQLSAIPTVSLRPEPIALDLKVILIGPPSLYYLLHALDEDFRELFRVKVDFAPEMDWSEEHVLDYGAFVSRRVRDDELRHFDRSAVARLVEHGARLRHDQRKLSTRLIEIANIVTEASFWAEKAGRELVSAEDVDRAVAKKEYRSNLIEERVREQIADGTLVINTTGERVGEVNGLSVVAFGDHAFGKPSRVTARIALGRGGVRSIEREIELSGPIHSKGFLTLAGYLTGTYAQGWPLALAATITFEQAYEGVEGDSASSTELYALLSALAGLPLRQSIAVTGSVNQYGEVQAVGGVTTKIEGFYAVCKAKGLTGDQGVVIPAANVSNLMLNDEVVDAVRTGRFHVWAAHSIDEGVELLTGRPAGVRGPDGSFPDGSVHRLVEDRLRGYAERLLELGGPRRADAPEDS